MANHRTMDQDSAGTRYTVRAYRTADRPLVRSICFETGLMGRSASDFYSDRESFADMFTAYFTDAEPEMAWVATPQCEPDRVVGYFLGAVDRSAVWDPGSILRQHVARRWLWSRPRMLAFLLRALVDQLGDRHPRAPAIDRDRFPACGHLNLLPEARYGGLGQTLHATFVERIVQLGVPGVCAETISENTRINYIMRNAGYQPAGLATPILGFRSPNGHRLHTQHWTLDLTRPNAPARALSPV